MKGTKEKVHFSDGLLSGSKVFMNKKYSYTCEDLFLKTFLQGYTPVKHHWFCMAIQHVWIT
jgi:hypothetical protein